MIYLLLPKNSKVRLTKKERQQKLKKQQEREELAVTLRHLADKRFPSSDKMSSAKRLDRLEICTAQTLAVMDRLLEFYEAKVCPFVNDRIEPTRKHQEVTATTTEIQQQVDTFAAAAATKHNRDHPYL